MQRHVTHLLRTFLHASTSFVSNQILHYDRYQPSVGFTDKLESDLYQAIASRYPVYQAPHGLLGKFLCSRFLEFSPSDERKLIQWVQVMAPDVIHVHFGVEAILFSKAIRKLNIPAVVSFYGHDCTSFPAKYQGLGLTMLKRSVFFNPAIKMILAMSPDMRADLIALGCPEEKIRLHYFGTDASQFVMDRSYTNKDVINFLIISHLEEKKGHRYLIDAFNKATVLSTRKIQLYMVGNGKLEQEIREQIASTGAKNIFMQGFVAYRSKEHLGLFKSADVFVHPSITAKNGNKEGIPGSIIEAMSAGLPVISTNHAGIPYVITHEKTGLLVNERDTDQLAAAILRLAASADLRRSLGTAARLYAQDELDVDKKLLEREMLYDELSGF
ncbi:MAG: glycosyltransferase [Bacteroidetes bacterium]|nr:glycosyltransferase [Bacteroidota bacterium]